MVYEILFNKTQGVPNWHRVKTGNEKTINIENSTIHVVIIVGVGRLRSIEIISRVLYREESGRNILT